MNWRFFQVRPFDWLVVALAAAVFVASLVVSTRTDDGASRVAITAAQKQYLYPLDGDGLMEFLGPLGNTVVEIRDAKVRVIEDPGPRQICVTQGWISRPGEWLACLPNRVFVIIQGVPSPGEVDGQAY